MTTILTNYDMERRNVFEDLAPSLSHIKDIVYTGP